MKVHAHLGPGDGFQLFSGTIYCRDTPDCNAPEGEPMGMINTMRLLAGNAKELGYSSPMDANEAIMEKRDGRFQEPDMQGMAELTGKSFDPTGAGKGQHRWRRDLRISRRSGACHITDLRHRHRHR